MTAKSFCDAGAYESGAVAPIVLASKTERVQIARSGASNSKKSTWRLPSSTMAIRIAIFRPGGTRMHSLPASVSRCLRAVRNPPRQRASAVPGSLRGAYGESLAVRYGTLFQTLGVRDCLGQDGRAADAGGCVRSMDA